MRPSTSPCQPSRSASLIRAPRLSRISTSRARWGGSGRRSEHLTQACSWMQGVPGRCGFSTRRMRGPFSGHERRDRVLRPRLQARALPPLRQGQAWASDRYSAWDTPTTTLLSLGSCRGAGPRDGDGRSALGGVAWRLRPPVHRSVTTRAAPKPAATSSRTLRGRRHEAGMVERIVDVALRVHRVDVENARQNAAGHEAHGRRPALSPRPQPEGQGRGVSADAGLPARGRCWAVRHRPVPRSALRPRPAR